MAASVEKHSEHPLGEAIVKKAKEEKLTLSGISAFKSITGRGVEGKIAGKNIYVGRILGSKLYPKGGELNKEGKTVVFAFNFSRLH